MTSSADYQLVALANGTWSLRSRAVGETFHPVIGPEAEAATLYADQIRLSDRLHKSTETLVIWDVGLGAAANAISVLRASRSLPGSTRLISFDQTLEPLRFALQHTDKLSYLAEYRAVLLELIEHQAAIFQDEQRSIQWSVLPGDFPSLLAGATPGGSGGVPAEVAPAPHAILYDPFSPARNPAMWTLPLFRSLALRLDASRPCVWANYSRSTLVRTTLLRAGFYVGVGQATGAKEETTVASNILELIRQPLDRQWLRRARNSTSAEPLIEPVYRQLPMTRETWDALMQHPQFTSEA